MSQAGLREMFEAEYSQLMGLVRTMQKENS